LNVVPVYRVTAGKGSKHYVCKDMTMTDCIKFLGCLGVSLPRGDTGLIRARLQLVKKEGNFDCFLKASGISRAYLLLYLHSVKLYSRVTKKYNFVINKYKLTSLLFISASLDAIVRELYTKI
jgi:hypothetical protein